MNIRNPRSICTVLAASLACALSACEKKSPPSATKPGAPGSANPSMKDTLSGAADKVKPAMEEAKDRAVAAAQSALDSARSEFESLRDRAPSVPPEAKAAYDKTIADLDDTWKNAKAKLDELKTAGSDAWRKVSADLSDATNKFTQNVRDAAKQYPAK